MENNQYANILEAVLFAAGEPVPMKKLCETMEIDEKTLKDTATALADYYDFEMRGLKLIRLEKSYQLCSRGEYSAYVRSVLEARKTNPLSQSVLEVLAIIAYKQPITKAYIEQIRGVDSSYSVGSLVDKGLIESCGKLDVVGRPLIYKTTAGFLRTFGISSLEELPTIKEFAQETPEQLQFEILPSEEEI